jgi:ATP-dependent DNA ligase
MPLPLSQRKAMLVDVLVSAHDEHLQFSGDFNDPVKLLDTCHKMGFEGILSKRRESAYRPGPTRDWLKIKTASWRAANRDRWELFDNRN